MNKINIVDGGLVQAILDSIPRPEIIKEGYHLEPNVTVYAENGYLRYSAYWEVVANVE